MVQINRSRKGLNSTLGYCRIETPDVEQLSRGSIYWLDPEICSRITTVVRVERIQAPPGNVKSRDADVRAATMTILMRLWRGYLKTKRNKHNSTNCTMPYH